MASIGSPQSAADRVGLTERVARLARPHRLWLPRACRRTSAFAHRRTREVHCLLRVALHTSRRRLLVKRWAPALAFASAM